jgi:hypothetical protein
MDGVSLILRIGDTDYLLDQLDAQGCRLTKLSGRERYRVTRLGQSVQCNCPDWVHRGRKEGRPCKHAEALLGQGLLREPTPDVETEAQP